jgi:hypothetical protein
MNLQLSQAEAALLMELLEQVNGRVQYADVQDQISNLINQIGDAE